MENPDEQELWRLRVAGLEPRRILAVDPGLTAGAVLLDGYGDGQFDLRPMAWNGDGGRKVIGRILEKEPQIDLIVLEGIYPGRISTRPGDGCPTLESLIKLTQAAGQWLALGSRYPIVRVPYRYWFPAMTGLSAQTKAKAAQEVMRKMLTGVRPSEFDRVQYCDFAWAGEKLGDAVNNDHIRDATFMALYAWAGRLQPDAEPIKTRQWQEKIEVTA